MGNALGPLGEDGADSGLPFRNPAFRSDLQRLDPYAADAVMPVLPARRRPALARHGSMGWLPATVSYRRRTVTSVVEVIRSFKAKIRRIQRAVRHFFLLRNAQLDALVAQWDCVYERQRRLFLEWSRRWKVSDPATMAEYSSREQAKWSAAQQHWSKQQRAMATVAAIQVLERSEEAPSKPSTPGSGRMKNRSLKLSASASQRALQSHTRSAPTDLHSPLVASSRATQQSAHSREDSSRPPTSAGEEDAEKAGQRQEAEEAMETPTATEEGKKKVGGTAATTVPRRLRHRGGHSLPAPSPPAAGAASAHRRFYSSAVPSPSSSSSSPSTAVAALDSASLSSPPSPPVLPQILTGWDRRFSDGEKRALLHADWKERRRAHARAKRAYDAAEEAYVREQCRGLTAAKRLLRMRSAGGPEETEADDEANLMSRAVAQAQFRAANPRPVFRALLTQAQMVSLINTGIARKRRGVPLVPSSGAAVVQLLSHPEGQPDPLQSSPSRKHRHRPSLSIFLTPSPGVAPSPSRALTPPRSAAASLSPSPRTPRSPRTPSAHKREQHEPTTPT